jgi:hypothetical protein
MKHVKIAVAVAIGLLSANTSFAACYDYQVVPASLDCSGGVQGNSADFGTNCTEVAAKLVQVTVSCPSTPSPSGGFSSGGEDRDSRAGDQFSGGGGFGTPH